MGDMPSALDREKPADLAAEMWGFAEVAEVFGVKISTVQRWARVGTLPRPRRFGRRPYWPASQIRAMVGGPADTAASATAKG